MSKTFKIITLGCKVNQYESAYLNEALIKAGQQKAADGSRAHITIINTCIVTQTASRQSRQEIRRAIRENPDGLIVATGCYAQAFPDELAEIQGLSLIAGNSVKGSLPDILLNLQKSGCEKIHFKLFQLGAPFEILPVRHFPDRSRAFLKIQDGCQSFCTYCIVPLARGHYRSMPPAEVLSMVESLACQGYKEIVLTGIHLGKYGVDLANSMNLNQLLVAIGKEDFPLRIRLSSLEINEIDNAIIDMAASEKWLCRHFHIPLQSGDAGILQKMNRHYTPQDVYRVIQSIHDKVPLAAIGLDVMCGFPGEDPIAHQNTYSLIRDMPISYLHVFPFSSRPGTTAATLEGRVGNPILKKRASEMRGLGKIKRDAFYKSCIKKDFIVLPEGCHSEKDDLMKGKSDNYLPIIFPSPHDPNQFVSVLIEKISGNMLMGSLC